MLILNRETLAAAVQRACVFSVNSPSIRCSGLFHSWGLTEMGISPSVTLARTCRAKNNAGKDKRTSLGTYKLVSHPLLNLFLAVFYLPMQAAGNVLILTFLTIRQSVAIIRKAQV